VNHSGPRNENPAHLPAPGAAPDAAPLIEFRNITKRYGGLYANRDVSLQAAKGEIHAVAGENGAGKTTLMHVLFGRVRPDGGSILLRGRPVRFRSPRDAIRSGIGMVHQNILIFPQLTVLENIVLGAEPSRHGIFGTAAARRDLLRLQELFGFDIAPDRQAEKLPFAQRQQIELLRLLYRGAEVLILDEPTSLLAPSESARLLEFLRQLRSRGRTILFITHRLGEVFSIADRITVLRKGRLAAERDTEKTSPQEIARLMVSGPDETDAPAPAAVRRDSDVPDRVRRAPPPEPPLLELRNLSVAPSDVEPGLENVSLCLGKGEIFGVAGIVGNGQNLLARALAGRIPARSGTILFRGVDITGLPLNGRLRAGICRLPENPFEESILPGRPLWENFLLSRRENPEFRSKGFLLGKEILQFARRQIDENDIAASGPFDPVSSLSGGNVQKTALAGVFAGSPRLAILEQPSRGLDLRASARLKQRILDLSAADGTTFIIISYDLDELIALCDRVAVFFRGGIMGIADRRSVSRDMLSRWMAGMDADEAREGMQN
jgi:simple sugar transport system ATP-binding protein